MRDKLREFKDFAKCAHFVQILIDLRSWENEKLLNCLIVQFNSSFRSMGCTRCAGRSKTSTGARSANLTIIWIGNGLKFFVILVLKQDFWFLIIDRTPVSGGLCEVCGHRIRDFNFNIVSKPWICDICAGGCTWWFCGSQHFHLRNNYRVADCWYLGRALTINARSNFCTAKYCFTRLWYLVVHLCTASFSSFSEELYYISECVIFHNPVRFTLLRFLISR